MPDSNRISASLSAEKLTAISALIASLNQALPFLVSLSATESRDLPKLGPKTIGFDERCASYMAQAPALVPAFIDLNEVNKDRALREQLSGVGRELGTLANRLDDTLAIVSHEIYSADLAFYQNVRQAAKRGIANAETILADLSTRFPGRPASSATKTSKTPATAAA